MSENNREDYTYAMRHSLAHILATAVQHLYPNTKFGVGPVIDNGFYYDMDLGTTTLSEEDFSRIEAEMKKIIKEDQPFEQFDLPIEDAISWAKEYNQPYKHELLNDLKRSGTTAVKDLDVTELGLESDGESKKKDVSFYKNDDFTDLCQGPHVKSTGKIGAFKLHRVSGAYWRGDEKNTQLQRVYGLAFDTGEELNKYIKMLEEAKKRDHRVIGEKLKLFTHSSEVGPGLTLWLPNGTVIKEELEKLGKETETKNGYQRVSTPHIGKEELYLTSGHLPYYKEDMYPPMKLENETYYLKPMNCPHMHMIYKSIQHSYRDLPLRYAEFGTVYRMEDRGALMGLLRVRGMTQNDAHIYCTEDSVVDELVSVIELHKYYYGLFDITDYYVELALPEGGKKAAKYFDNPKGWEKAIELLRQAAKKADIKVIEKEGEAAFYGPKFDFNIKSAIGKEFGASTNQLDFGSGKRFGLTYADSDGKDKSVPYIIHQAPLGSDERFIGFLIEHYGGKFPLWLAPEQLRIITVNQEESTSAFAEELNDSARSLGIRSVVDNSNESVGKKIREAEVMKVPYTVVIGEEEMKSKQLKPRIRKDMVVQSSEQAISMDEFLKTIAHEAKARVNKTSLHNYESRR